MSKRKRKQVYFPVLSKQRDQSISAEVVVQRVRNFDGLVLLTQKYYASDTISEHRAIGDTHGNHTTPTVYTMYAVKAEPKKFRYAWPRTTDTHYEASGTTWFNTSDYGVMDLRHVGLRPSGDLWVPDISSDMINQALTEAKQKLSSSDFNLATSLAEAKEAIITMSSLLTSMAGLVTKLVKEPSRRSITINRFVYYVQNNSPLPNLSGVPSKLPPSTKKTMAAQYEAQKKRIRKKYAKMVRDAANSRSGAYGPLQVPGWLPPSLREKPNFRLTRIRVKQRRKVSKKWRYPNGSLVAGAEKTWLTAMYAILPLWFDFVALSGIGADALRKPGAHVEALRVLEKAGSLPASTSSVSVEGKVRKGVEVFLSYRVADTYTDFLASIGLLNPFAVWWELTPYSFVFDWLMPISRTLEALTADLGLDFLSGYTNQKSFADVTCRGILPGKSGTLPQARFQNVAQVRAPVVTSPIVGFYMKSPFSASHAISAIALLGQQMR